MPPRRAAHHYTRVSPYHTALSVESRARMDTMRTMRAAGLSNTEIARVYNISPGRVTNLFRKYGK